MSGSRTARNRLVSGSEQAAPTTTHKTGSTCPLGHAISEAKDPGLPALALIPRRPRHTQDRGSLTLLFIAKLCSVDPRSRHIWPPARTSITFQSTVSIQVCFLLCWVDGTSIQAPEAGSDRRGENPSRSASPVANRRFPRRPAGADSVALPCRGDRKRVGKECRSRGSP